MKSYPPVPRESGFQTMRKAALPGARTRVWPISFSCTDRDPAFSTTRSRILRGNATEGDTSAVLPGPKNGNRSQIRPSDRSTSLSSNDSTQTRITKCAYPKVNCFGLHRQLVRGASQPEVIPLMATLRNSHRPRNWQRWNVVMSVLMQIPNVKI